ncbi:sorting nexin-4-like [Sebastes fasciatus]|uniref:sorting nexin-4-like n=1 Tax=Sebastes fasciatus TaxID=394691 RepID=UPI003D9DE13C
MASWPADVVPLDDGCRWTGVYMIHGNYGRVFRYVASMDDIWEEEKRYRDQLRHLLCAEALRKRWGNNWRTTGPIQDKI